MLGELFGVWTLAVLEPDWAACPDVGEDALERVQEPFPLCGTMCLLWTPGNMDSASDPRITQIPYFRNPERCSSLAVLGQVGSW